MPQISPVHIGARAGEISGPAGGGKFPCRQDSIEGGAGESNRDFPIEKYRQIGPDVGGDFLKF